MRTSKTYSMSSVGSAYLNLVWYILQ